MKPMPARSRESFLSDFISIELARGDRFVDSSKVLENDATRAQVEMTYFGVSHLAVGQSDIDAARAKFASGIVAIELVVKGRTRKESGVPVLLRFRFTAWINAPAVAND